MVTTHTLLVASYLVGRSPFQPDGFHSGERPTLLPGENPDLRAELLDTLGAEWLAAPNLRLAGRAPAELLGTAEEAQLRDILRSVTVAALS